MHYVSLISGGIDSPVAAHLFLKQDLPLKAIIYDLSPFTDQKEVDSALKSIKKLSSVHKREIEASIVPLGPIHRRYLDQAEGGELNYVCLFCKRMMLRAAEALMEPEGLVTGESLGQVATQTLDNTSLIDSAIDIPVYRPLLGFNKMEIVSLAKEVGTFSLAATNSSGCRARAQHPVTHGKVTKIKAIESKIDLKKLIDSVLEQREMRKIRAC